MATLGPWEVDDIPFTIEDHPAVTAVLNADIETFTAFKDTLKDTPVKAIFESIIVILTLVRVRLLVLSHPRIRLLIARSGRGDRGRFVCRTGENLCQNVPRVEDSDRREGYR